MSNYSLFNDPFFKEQFEKLPESEKKKYKQAGEHMYNRDYTTENNFNDKMKEALKYIEISLQSGMFPSELSDDEKQLLQTFLGEEWYKKYDYPSADYNGTN